MDIGKEDVIGTEQCMLLIIMDRVVNEPPTIILNKVLFINFTYICLNVRLICIFIFLISFEPGAIFDDNILISVHYSYLISSYIRQFVEPSAVINM